MFKDDTLELYGQYFRDRFWIHSQPEHPVTPIKVKHWAQVIMTLEDYLRDRGFSEYYTCAVDPGTFKFAQKFGFDSAGEHIGEEVEIMKKAI